MARRRLSRRQQARISAARTRRRETEAARQPGRAVTGGDGTALGAEQTGLVICRQGRELLVEDGQGGLHACKQRRNLGILVAGDQVIWQAEAVDSGVVVAALERRSLLAQPGTGDVPRPLAANIDQVAVVLAPRPEPAAELLDRYLAAVEELGLRPLLIVNKIDLLGDEPKRTGLAARLDMYRRIGYPVFWLGCRDGAGISQLRQRLRGHVSVLVGQSGVGKSSLTALLMPDLEIRVRALSQASGLGTHTTSTSTLYHLQGGGDLIDSPGVRNFQPQLRRAGLEAAFREFRPYLGHCRFSNCRHLAEPDCALTEALRRGRITPCRLASFQRLREELEDRER